MAGAPRFKVYDAANVYQAAVKDVTLAAAVVSLLGEGATVRDGRRYIWREGGDEIAGESYDEAADTMLRRIRYNQTFKAKREPLPTVTAFGESILRDAPVPSPEREPWGKCEHCNEPLYADTGDSDPCPHCGKGGTS